MCIVWILLKNALFKGFSAFFASWWALDGQETAMASFQEDQRVGLPIVLMTDSSLVTVDYQLRFLL